MQLKFTEKKKEARPNPHTAGFYHTEKRKKTIFTN
jgi:hypothetical protein